MAYPISRYLSVQQAYSPVFTADGRAVVFLANITGTPQVWQVAPAGEQGTPPWPDQLTFEADRVQNVWSSPVAGDDRLIYARDMGGNENAQLFLLSVNSGEETALTAGYDGAMHTLSEWSEDGARILFAANRRDPGLFDLYLQPLDGKARMIWQNETPGYLVQGTFSPDGRRAAVVRAHSSFQHELFEVDLETGEVVDLTPSQEMARYTAVAYATDGRALFVNTDLASDFLHIARLDLDDRAVEPVVAAEWDIEHMARSPDGRLLAYIVNEDGSSKLVVWEIESRTSRSAPDLGASPGVVAWLDGRLRFSSDSTRLAFSFTGATRTSDIYIWNIAEEAVEVVTRSSHGGLPVDSFIAPDLIRYPTFDERQIPAWFFRPAGDQSAPTPAIVVVHGGPESQFVPYFHFLVQYFAHHGYAVLAPNVRGSTGYGKAYSHLDDVRKRMDSVADLAHAARWLAGQPGVDGERLVVYGGSYGGFMVLASLTTYPELWAAGVDIVGISNFATFLENTSAYRRKSREAEYGSLEDDREFLESIAPINHLDKIAAPLLVIHGANDPRVPLSEARQLVAALEARNVPVELLVFDDEGHGVVKLKNKLVAYPAVVDFLNRQLAG